MHSYSFFGYSEEAEKKDGDYWKFLDSTIESLETDNIFLDDINQILKKIKNEDLKSKMKQKLFNLIMENSLWRLCIHSSLDLFSEEELKQIMEHEYDVTVPRYTKDEDEVKRHQGDFASLMRSFNKVKDDEWIYSMISRIINSIKDFENKSSLVNLIELNKYYKEIYDRLIKEYYDYLPIEYKKFLKMSEDPYYIHKKSLEFMDKNIDIGIDPKISIGPEIEANNDYNIHIELYNQKGFENFIQKSDATVPNGDEVAPEKPFHNTKEDVARFCGLCEAMKDIGYYYSEIHGNASGQINLGLDYLDTKEAILNFYEIYGNCEELLYYISSVEGQLFRQDVYSTSRIKPISQIIGKRTIDEELTRKDIISLFHSSYENNSTIEGLEYKKNSVCLRGTTNSNYRLEFRIPNGGCNYKTWIDNIRLYGKMFEVSKKIADFNKKDYLNEEEENLLKLKLDLQDNKLTLEEKLVILMNLLFKEDNIKQIYYNRYISTIKKIEETNSKKYMNIYNSFQPNFDEIEFIDQYHSRFDSDYDSNSTIYDPETDKIIKK